jgi:hypothetical protein
MVSTTPGADFITPGKNVQYCQVRPKSLGFTTMTVLPCRGSYVLNALLDLTNVVCYTVFQEMTVMICPKSGFVCIKDDFFGHYIKI